MELEMDVQLSANQRRVFHEIYYFHTYSYRPQMAHFGIQNLDKLKLKRVMLSKLLNRLIKKGLVESRKLAGIEEFLLTEQGQKLGQALNLK